VQELEDPLVDAVRGEQPVHVDAAHLAHPVRAGDRLLLDRGRQLRLGDDHHQGGLDVQADAARRIAMKFPWPMGSMSAVPAAGAW